MAGDAYYASVSLLLHGDGANGSTTFTDNSPAPKPVTAVGNAQISTEQSKWGGASMKFDGTGDYATVPHSTVFSIQGGDFTIEMWVYRAASGVSHYLLSKRSAATNDGWELRINATNYLQFFHTAGSSVIGAVAVPSGSWSFLKVIRSGTTLSMYIDGAAAGSGTVSNGTENTDATLKIGCDNVSSTGFNGYIDDIRISKGVARSPDVPSSAFRNYAAEVSGVVYDDTGAPCARTVRLVDRATGVLIGSATSNVITGVYSIRTDTLDEVQRIVMDDSGGTLYNDIIDRVIPA